MVIAAGATKPNNFFKNSIPSASACNHLYGNVRFALSSSALVLSCLVLSCLVLRRPNVAVHIHDFMFSLIPTRSHDNTMVSSAEQHRHLFPIDTKQHVGWPI